MKIVLLDRDGTVLVDPPDLRVDSVNKIKLFPDSIEALRYLADNGYGIIFITNQAAIGEGRITLDEFEFLHEKFKEMLRPSGIKIIATYFSPDVEGSTSKYRKPNPGMILRAADEYDFELADTYMIGDRQSDITAGIRAGTKTILVKTGNSEVEVPEADYTVKSLLDAVKYIVAKQT